MRVHPLALSLAFALSIGCSDALAQWMWRDAAGRVTVSDRPPPQDVPPSAIVSKPPGADQRAAAPRRAAAPSSDGANVATPNLKQASATNEGGAPPRDPELEARRKKAEAEMAEKRRADEQKNAEIKRDNCKRARSYAATIESGMRIVRTNEKGEREYLDDRERAAEAARTKESIASNCNG